MSKPVKTAKERAGERIVDSGVVKVTAQPTGGKIVRGIPSKTKISRKRQT